MLPGQMLPGQMSLLRFELFQEGPRNLPLKFGPNRASNSCDIADIEFRGGGGGGGGGWWWWCKVIFM